MIRNNSKIHFGICLSGNHHMYLISFNKGTGNVHEHTCNCTFKDVFKLTWEKLHLEVTYSTFLVIFPEKVITKKLNSHNYSITSKRGSH